MALLQRGINPIIDDKFFDRTKFKAVADDKIDVAKTMLSVFDQIEKHWGKERKGWLRAFSPFPTMFSKCLFFRVIKSWDCVVKS